MIFIYLVASRVQLTDTKFRGLLKNIITVMLDKMCLSVTTVELGVFGKKCEHEMPNFLYTMPFHWLPLCCVTLGLVSIEGAVLVLAEFCSCCRTSGKVIVNLFLGIPTSSAFAMEAEKQGGYFLTHTKLRLKYESV